MKSRKRRPAQRDLGGPLLGAVFATIDAANAEDPNLLPAGPRAKVEGERATAWVEQLDVDASDELLIAARAHHLRRWTLPRSTYPTGRAGYLRWRRDQKKRHGDEVAPMMQAAGYGESSIVRTQELLLRGQLGTDAETQTLEDAACLVFLEVQYDGTAAQLGDDDTIRVLRKTLTKMSEPAQAVAAQLDLSTQSRELLERAAAPELG